MYQASLFHSGINPGNITSIYIYCLRFDPRSGIMLLLDSVHRVGRKKNIMQVQLTSDKKSIVITLPIEPRPLSEKGNQTIATSGGNRTFVIGKVAVSIGVNAYVKGECNIKDLQS